MPSEVTLKILSLYYRLYSTRWTATRLACSSSAWWLLWSPHWTRTICSSYALVLSVLIQFTGELFALYLGSLCEPCYGVLNGEKRKFNICKEKKNTLLLIFTNLFSFSFSPPIDRNALNGLLDVDFAKRSTPGKTKVLYAQHVTQRHAF